MKYIVIWVYKKERKSLWKKMRKKYTLGTEDANLPTEPRFNKKNIITYLNIIITIMKNDS